MRFASVVSHTCPLARRSAWSGSDTDQAIDTKSGQKAEIEGLLKRTRAALNLPVSTFHETHDGSVWRETSAQEFMIMFDLFTSIEDPREREQYLAFLSLVARSY